MRCRRRVRRQSLLLLAPFPGGSSRDEELCLNPVRETDHLPQGRAGESGSGERRGPGRIAEDTQRGLKAIVQEKCGEDGVGASGVELRRVPRSLPGWEKLAKTRARMFSTSSAG